MTRVASGHRRPAAARPLAQGGFSLIELLTVLAILAVVATLAVPSFSYLVDKSRVKAAAIDLEIALVRARSEAVKRNSDVTLTPNTGGWKYGWTLQGSDGSTLDHGDAINGINFVSAPGSVTYLTSGRVSGTPPQFSIAALGRPTMARCVAVDLSGRPYATESAC